MGVYFLFVWEFLLFCFISEPVDTVCRRYEKRIRLLNRSVSFA